MNLFAKAISLLTFYKTRGKGLHSFSQKEIVSALQNCFHWFEQVQDDNGLPASSYSLLLGQASGPSARNAAHWLEALALLSALTPPALLTQDSLKHHAATLAQWLVSIQRKDGTWPVGSNDYKNRPPSVFQTGIIVCALIAYSEKFGVKPDVSKAIENAVHWLIKMQNDNGGWDQYVFGKHLICTNSASALIRAGIYLNDPSLVSHGNKAIDYYFSFQIGNGFYYFLPSGQKDYFASDYGFILNGFARAACLLGNRSYAQKLWHGIMPVIQSAKGHGIIPGIINYEFNAPVNYYSLYGSVMAMLAALRIIALIRNEEITHSCRLIAQLIASAQIKSDNKFIHGGFSVSQPSSGGYKPYEISGDAIAVYAEALLLLLKTGQPADDATHTGSSFNIESIL